MKLHFERHHAPRRLPLRGLVGLIGGSLLLGLTAWPPVVLPAAGSGSGAAPAVPCPSGPAAPAGDKHSLSGTADTINAETFWNAGYTGRGVDVAVIDTGVAPVDGFTAPGKIAYGPDLSFESQSPVAHIDTYGHGTHMASIIGGRSNDVTASVNGGLGTPSSNKSYFTQAQTKFMGIAPDSRIVSLKVADSDGVADVTQVIAAVNWVVEHRNTDGLNIRVLNLSYGVDAYDTWRSDPLSYAVDQAFKAGIVVVAPAGNDGRAKNTPLNSPAYNENIIAVGAYDPVDNVVPDFSNDSGRRLPDFVAPGQSIAALRVCGSAQDAQIASDKMADEAAGKTFVTPYVGERFVRGSGTSQAAAVTSGAAALLLQKNPCWNPAQVRTVLRQTAKTVTGQLNSAVGQGRLDLAGAYTASRACGAPLGTGWAGGTGTLEGSRGGSHLWDASRYCTNDDGWKPETLARIMAMFPGTEESALTATSCYPFGRWFASDDGRVLSGERDIFGNALSATGLAAPTFVSPTTRQLTNPQGAWTTTPAGEMWNGTVWTGAGFSTTAFPFLTGIPAWNVAVWPANSWVMSSYRENSVWDVVRWRDNGWDVVRWRNENWDVVRWRDNGWDVVRWREDGWDVVRWRQGGWS